MGGVVRAGAFALVFVTFCASTAGADDGHAPWTPAEKKARYALPFAMRPAIAPNLVRIDAGLALGTSDTIETNILTAGGKPIASLPDLGFYGRGALVHRSPKEGDSGTVLSNPLAFALYAPEIAPKVRLPLFLGVAAPIGGGGGDSADSIGRLTISSAVYARQAMDNALFGPNYLTTAVGAGLAWIDRGVTVQGEVTTFFLRRVRGEPVDADAARTNFTTGLNVGYLVLPLLTVNFELHYQRWLSTPSFVERDEARPDEQKLGVRDQLTFGGGVRANLPIDDSTIVRPGIAFFRGIDKPMSDQKYSIVMLDLPIAF